MNKATIQMQPNGFGATYQCLAFGYAYCKKYKLEYHHTPLHFIHHNCKFNLAEKFIGFKESLPVATKDVKMIEYNFHGTKDIDNLITDEVIKDLQTLYYKEPKKLYDENNIVIHIRKGDVNKKNHPDRWIELEEYIDVLNYFTKNYPDYKIYICSQGLEKEFELFKDFDIEYKLNEDVLETFNFMVQASILFIARSSYSYMAGFLNNNIVYCDMIKKKSWFHYPKQKWLTI
jgi:hypothetical protein